MQSPSLFFKNGERKTKKEERANEQYEQIEGGIQHTPGPVVRKLVNANPGLKFDLSISFCC